MNGWSGYHTVFLLTDTSGKTVNKYMQRYVLWEGRQAGRGITKIVQRGHEPAVSAKFPFQRILTEEGGELVNKDMKAFYAKHGIEHIKVGPNSSHLNAVERAIHSLNDYTKTQMHKSGFALSLWWYAFLYGVYIKNMMYHRAIYAISVQRMLGVKADAHHLRPFGSLVNIQVLNTPERPKSNDNAIISYLLGFEIDIVGARVYFFSENSVKFVAEVRVIEDKLDSKTTRPASRVTAAWTWKASMSLARASYLTTRGMQSLLSVLLLRTRDRSADVDEDDEDEDHDNQDGGENRQDTGDRADDSHDDDESVSANFKSKVDPADEGSVADATEVGEDVSYPTDEQESTHEQGSEAKNHTENGRSKDCDDTGAVSEPTVTERSVLEKIILPEGLRKRVERDDTPSEERMKERRTGLRQWTSRPARFDDFVRWESIATKILGRNGRPIGVKNIRVPKNRRQAI
ncbi:Ribonuclease H-like domain [Plasmopara halstedii]|uniref:Ribonuclease H-like domain n=1 Tax=Plasmopara halstedii TaxID=4781 RepID=A0A0P1A682_PLAHL|nr:Ribonuclease H-like domain [Plasmopara halstedii]CEG36090.1 Ribonuclease H-like domain [Plasmopara halstedii]|eukprot:XP_024572459.1 Ribonuclease H-like domain [Plasmopara halstedii]